VVARFARPPVAVTQSYFERQQFLRRIFCRYLRKGREMLNKHNLEIARLASKETESRYALSVIHITPEETVETDGRQMVIVTTTKSEGLIPEDIKATDKFEPFSIPASMAVEIAASLAKGDKVRVQGAGRVRSKTIKKQLHAAIDSMTNKNGNAVLGIVDSQGSERIFKAKKSAGKFPNYKTVVPAKEEAQAAFSLNLALLIPVLQQMMKFAKSYNGANPATFRFYAANKQIRIDAENFDTGQIMTAVIMPMKMQDI